MSYTPSLNKGTKLLTDLSQVVNAGLEYTINTTSDIVESNNATGGVEELEKLHSCMEKYLNLQQEINTLLVGSDVMKNKLDEEKFDTSLEVDEYFNAVLVNTREECKTNITENHNLKLLEAQITLLKNVDKADGMDYEDDELMVVESQMAFKDPLTMQDICDPVKNRYCKHYYERSSIINYIRSKSKGRCICPYVGCINARDLKIEDLVDDLVLKLQLGKKRKEQKAK